MNDSSPPPDESTFLHSTPAAAAGPAADLARNSDDLDAGLEVAFGGDADKRSSSGGSIWQALATDPGGSAHIRLPELQGEASPTVSRPRSDQMPGPHDLPARLQLLGEIARGGMGAVFEGRDLKLCRDIAVKVLLENHKGRTELLQRFLEEAQIAGQLQHPGIVPVYDVGQVGDQRPYFTMKLVRGHTLAELLKERTSQVRSARPTVDAPRDRGTCPDPRSLGMPTVAFGSVALDSRLLGIFEQVCQTIAYANARGVIHRDLKPANIMVGSFGEVQVMDWGLAKVLRTGAARASASLAAPDHVVQTVRSQAPGILGTNAPEQSNLQTQADMVLGTAAYMAPEQARAEALDERCDVFGLGATLCEILTGRPPYCGHDTAEILQKALHADLADARARLDGCGADADLIALARRCLAPDRRRRPRNAGEVVAAMTAYQQSVQARLRQAEVERAAALARAAAEEQRRHAEEARSTAERQRRRATVALAVCVVLLVAGIAAVGLWWQQEQGHVAQEHALRQQRKQYMQREVAGALTETEQLDRQLRKQLADPLHAQELLSDIDGWEQRVQKARAAWQRAQALSDADPDQLGEDMANRLQDLEKVVTADEHDVAVARRLDSIRLESAAAVDGKLQLFLSGPKCAVVFRELGLDVEKSEPTAVAAAIRRLPLRFVLVTALDFWATGALDKDALRQERLLQVARLADPDPWRDKLRSVRAWHDRELLQQLTAKVPVDRQSSQVLMMLGQRLRFAGGDSAPLLRRSLAVYPRDFWLYFELAAAVTDPVEELGCYQAAVALRPGTDVAHFNLANVLHRRQDRDAAIAHFRKCVELNPRWARAHLLLGEVLSQRNDPESAVVHFCKCLELDPRSALAHEHLGKILAEKKDLAGASAEFQKALQLDPMMATAHYDLGVTLRLQKKDADGAIVHLRRALELDPKLVDAHVNLALALEARKTGPDAELVLEHFRQALALDANFVPAHYYFGISLLNRKDMAGAAEHFGRVIALDPRHAKAHSNLGFILAQQHDMDGAIDHFRKAVALDPNLALAQFNLGEALLDRKDFNGAMPHLRKAVQLLPTYAPAHQSLGEALMRQGHYALARAEILQALRLLPSHDPRRQAVELLLQQGDRLLAEKSLAEVQQACQELWTRVSVLRP
jgi:serine/threonine protein kinase/tetratricopeptide (TPR) repeat protein